MCRENTPLKLEHAVKKRNFKTQSNCKLKWQLWGLGVYANFQTLPYSWYRERAHHYCMLPAGLQQEPKESMMLARFAKKRVTGHWGRSCNLTKSLTNTGDRGEAKRQTTVPFCSFAYCIRFGTRKWRKKCRFITLIKIKFRRPPKSDCWKI